MKTLAGIAADIQGTKTVTYYTSPTHVATLARVVQIPGSDQHPYLYLLLVWQRRPNGPGNDAPDLIIASETTDGGRDHVIGVYDATEHQILLKELGDWADIGVFEHKAVNLVSERFNTVFVEQVPREGRDS